MPRPPVDVVVPFRGTPANLEKLRRRLARLHLRPGDSLVVVDNTPKGGPVGVPTGEVPVIQAADIATPGFARNCGAARGSADWLVFFDADVDAPPDLLDRFFDPPPDERTALLAGGVVDERVPSDARPAARYAYIRELMSQDNTYRFGEWSFPQMANAACRRVAFDEMGGFHDRLRAGEDADLCYRLKTAGWEVERREAAAAPHRGRQTVRGFIAQKLLHGSGGGLARTRIPGGLPTPPRPRLLWWGLRHAATGLAAARRSGDRDEAIWAVFEPLELLAFEFGRLLPNERPPAPRWWAPEGSPPSAIDSPCREH